MPPPAAARHTTTERERRGTARRPRAVLGFGQSAIQLHLVRRQHRFNSFAIPVRVSPQRKFTAPPAGVRVPRHANERAIWRP